MPFLSKQHGTVEIFMGSAADTAGGVWLLNGDGELARVKDCSSSRRLPQEPARLALVRKPKGGFWIQRDNEVWVLEMITCAPCILMNLW